METLEGIAGALNSPNPAIGVLKRRLAPHLLTETERDAPNRLCGEWLGPMLWSTIRLQEKMAV
jgi:hypothetical protein